MIMPTSTSSAQPSTRTTIARTRASVTLSSTRSRSVSDGPTAICSVRRPVARASKERREVRGYSCKTGLAPCGSRSQPGSTLAVPAQLRNK